MRSIWRTATLRGARLQRRLGSVVALNKRTVISAVAEGYSYFGARYFGPNYFGPRYFPAGEGAIVGGQFFSNSYFGNRYFGPRYF